MAEQFLERTSVTPLRLITAAVVAALVLLATSLLQADDSVSPDELARVERIETQRIRVIEQVIGSVVAVYGEDRQGGGSGVIIDPSGIALTNHHVIQGAGVRGLGGLANGKLYPWKLIGTDPGGDVAVIQLEGRESFPWAPLGDSDKVRVGDWALAMGNPFLLAKDHVPTVTLGVISGVKRYQSGSRNQLVYGNCLQVDSSINPGNSGGPLFNMDGEVIGINGRGSFRDRGRVNVGLGYAISSNQIKHFLPDLLATKLVEHGTLDASFADRNGKVVCSTLNLDAPIAKRGLELGDELIEFEGTSIEHANQFTNLICTLPEDWPAHLVFRKPNGDVRSVHVRLYGLPYPRPKPSDKPSPDDEDGGEGDDDGEPDKRGEDGERDEERQPEPEEQRRRESRRQMIELLSAEPGIIRDESVNQRYARHFVRKWKLQLGLAATPSSDSAGSSADGSTSTSADRSTSIVKLKDTMSVGGEIVGTQELWLAPDGRFRIRWRNTDEAEAERNWGFDGERYWKSHTGGQPKELTLTQAKLNPIIYQVVAMLSPRSEQPLHQFGKLLLDGSGKAAGRVACRLKTLDDRDDWFYIWLQLYDENQQPVTKLLKASSELDADRNGGAVLFGDWSVVHGMPVARQRQFVDGLSESPRRTFSTEMIVTAPELPGDWFSPPAADQGSGQSQESNR